MKYICPVHIELTEENTDRMLKASNQLDLSVASIVNRLVASIDCLKIQEEIRIGLKTLEKPGRFKKIHSIRRFRADFF